MTQNSQESGRDTCHHVFCVFYTGYMVADLPQPLVGFEDGTGSFLL